MPRHDPSESATVAGPTRSMIVYGTDEPPAPTHPLRAGRISATLDGGNLRHVRFGGVEIIRAVSFMVRDTAWGTYRPRVEDLSIDEDGGRCHVNYRATCAGPEGTFRYGATIALAPDGTIVFEVEGSPIADFPTNRTGFVVLHPLEGVAGSPVEVLHTDGRAERSRFPVLIEPWQPVFDIRALTHEPRPGLVVTCRLEGDAYEMEDHRNWGDASYKTYVRPLAKGFPYEIAEGERVAQSVHITAVAAAAVREPEVRTNEPVRIALGPVGGTLPAIGLAVDAAEAAAALDRKDLVAAAGVQSLIVRFDARRHGAGEAEAAEALRQALGTAATLEVVIPGLAPQMELAAVAVALEGGGLRPSAVVVSPVRDLTSRPTGPIAGEASLR